MHAIPFELKSAHLGAVAFGREALDGVPGMTPARYDLLYSIREAAPKWWGSAWWRGVQLPGSQQSYIVRQLGLHASTVSEMIDRLVALGWLTKKRDSGDGRRNFIQLTEVGLVAIELAMKVVPRRKVHSLWFARHFAERRRGPTKEEPERRIIDRKRTSAAIWQFARAIVELRLAFGRPPQLQYDQPHMLYEE